jgi:hypothetical protein
MGWFRPGGNIAAVLFALFATYWLALAAETPQPGLWEITSKTQRGSMIKSSPPQILCMNADQLAALAHARSPPENSHCHHAELRKTSAGEISTLACEHSSFTTENNVVLNTAQQFSGSTKVTMTFTRLLTQTAVMSFQARRLGECKK